MTRLWVGLLAALLALGCVSIRPLGLDGALQGNEGALVVDLVTEVPVKALRLDAATAVEGLPAGEHLLLVAVPAGSYRWTDIVIAADDKEVPFRTSLDDVWKFRIEPGRINYTGQIEFRGSADRQSWALSFRYRNRSAHALIRLREKFPAWLDRYPAVFGGAVRDDFLKFYSETIAGGADARSAP